MAYEKTTWQSGDVVTSEKLNNIENGIANRSMVIHTTDNGVKYVMDKTFSEVLEAFNDGTFIIVKSTVSYEDPDDRDEKTGLVLATSYNIFEGEKSNCTVEVGEAAAAAIGVFYYTASSENDYPEFQYAD